MELLFTKDGQLEAAYCFSDPTKDRTQNVLHLLSHHLSHARNAGMLPRVMAVAEEVGPHAIRLLRVLCKTLFCPELYSMGNLIGRGAYARVSSGFCDGDLTRCPDTWRWKL